MTAAERSLTRHGAKSLRADERMRDPHSAGGSDELRLTEKSPPAIVLHGGRTALATARCLAELGIRVYVLCQATSDVSAHSKSAVPLKVPEECQHGEALFKWLANFASMLTSKPVIFPGSDAMAIALAQHGAHLRQHCTFSISSPDDIDRIVSKDRLYEHAARIGVKVPSTIAEPDIDRLAQWCEENSAPYFAKPFYMTVADSSLKTKNEIFDSKDELLGFVSSFGSKNVLIQRYIDSGDGHIYDCYGYCDRNHRIVSLASHKRIRQNPPHRGITSFGEIPGAPRAGEQTLFENTATLLNGLNYHGIFGIEWMEDKSTGELLLADFNARPFSSIGHLRDCGLNLPYLAYRELCGDDVSDVPLHPQLKHKFWLDMKGDLNSMRIKRKSGEIGVLAWLASLRKTRSLAFFSIRDPLPVLHNARLLVARFFRYFGS